MSKGHNDGLMALLRAVRRLRADEHHHVDGDESATCSCGAYAAPAHRAPEMAPPAADATEPAAMLAECECAKYDGRRTCDFCIRQHKAAPAINANGEKVDRWVKTAQARGADGIWLTMPDVLSLLAERDTAVSLAKEWERLSGKHYGLWRDAADRNDATAELRRLAGRAHALLRIPHKSVWQSASASTEHAHVLEQLERAATAPAPAVTREELADALRGVLYSRNNSMEIVNAVGRAKSLLARLDAEGGPRG